MPPAVVASQDSLAARAASSQDSSGVLHSVWGIATCVAPHVPASMGVGVSHLLCSPPWLAW